MMSENIDIQKIILDIFDYSYANSPIKLPAIACREVGKLLHTGMFIEEIKGQIPGFQFSPSELKGLQGKKSEQTLGTAQQVRDSYASMNSKWGLYEEDIQFTDINICYIIGKLNNLYISDPKKDIFGDALELFRSQWAKQEGGQFFTDQRVTSLAIKMIEFTPEKGETLVDLCSGTGGFLLAALNHIKHEADLSNKDEQFVISTARKSLRGFEIDSSVAELGNATLSARLGSSNSAFIKQANSLDKNETNEKYTKAVTNPPFGAKITIQDDYILSQYELARLSNSNCNDTSIRGTKLFKRAPDILFIERNISILEDGGVLAIVVPYQILSGPQTYYVRNWLLRNTKLLASIDLPAETFQPHTGTKTCLLVVEKLAAPLLSLESVESYDIFMSCPKWIGHDRRGNTIYKKDLEGNTTQDVLTDFPELELAYKAYKKKGAIPAEYDRAYVINSQEILSDELLRFNAAYFNPEHSTKLTSIDTDKFELLPLSDFADRVFFPGRFKRNYVEKYDKAVPFLGGANITQMISHTDKWLRHDDPKLDQLSVKAGWILVTRSGTTGIVSSVPEYWDGFAISEHVIRIVPNGKIDANYLLAFLKTPQCKAALAQGVFGSVIDEITPETIENIMVPVPKSKALYKKVSQQVAEAEKHRSDALRKMYSSVDILAEELA